MSVFDLPRDDAGPDDDTDADETVREVSDLLTDDGEVDYSAVARIANKTGDPPGSRVSATECSRLRERALGLSALKELVPETERCHETVYEHVSGRCSHTAGETDLPPLVYDTSHEGGTARSPGVWQPPSAAEDGGDSGE